MIRKESMIKIPEIARGYTGAVNIFDGRPIKIHVRRAAGRGYSYFHFYMCVFFVYVSIYLCHASWSNDK